MSKALVKDLEQVGWVGAAVQGWIVVWFGVENATFLCLHTW